MKRCRTGPALVLLLAAGACGTSIDTTGLAPSIADYRSWPVITETADVPGHPDSVRDIYYNPIAQTYPHGGPYPIGTAIVKEVYDKGAGGEKGGLRYLAIMRKVPVGTAVPTNQGWLFSDAPGPGGGETQRDLCWNSCHRAGPFDGAWHDYGANP